MEVAEKFYPIASHPDNSSKDGNMSPKRNVDEKSNPAGERIYLRNSKGRRLHFYPAKAQSWNKKLPDGTCQILYRVENTVPILKEHGIGSWVLCHFQPGSERTKAIKTLEAVDWLLASGFELPPKLAKFTESEDLASYLEMEVVTPRASSTPAKPETGNRVAEICTDLQLRILEELYYSGLTAEGLERRIGRSIDAIKRALKGLSEAGKVKNKRGLGYFRPDAPPKPCTDD